MSGHDNGVNGVNGSTGRSGHGHARRAGVSRRAFVAGAGAASVAAWARRAAAQPKATITYWNGLTGADGKVMDELIDRFTQETGIRSSSSAFRGPSSTPSCRCRCRRARARTWR